MSFKSIVAPALGIGSMGSMIFAQKQQFKVFVAPTFPDLDEINLEISSYTGAFLGKIPLDIQETIVTSLEFRYGEEGSIDFSIELNQEPSIPLLRFTEVALVFNTEKIFRGYIWKSPGPDKKPGESWKYSGYGMAKRLEKAKVILKPDVNVFQIDHIEQMDNDSKVFVDPLLPEANLEGRVCIVEDADDDNNNGRFDITYNEFVQFVQFVNPAGLEQVLNKGLLTILPKEWSEPTTTLSQLLRQVVSNYVVNLPISSGVGSIEDNDSLLTGSVINIDKITIAEFFKQLRMITQDMDLFVDGDSVINFRNKPTKPISTIVLGYDGHDVENHRNEDEVVNRWTVNRKLGKEEDRSGFEIGGLAQDDTSIKNFGLVEDDQEVPVYYGDELCQKMAEALVEQTKDPKDTITIKSAPFAHYKIGPWRVITNPRPDETILDDCESTDGWTTSGTVSLSVETENVVFGAGAIKASYGSGSTGATFSLAMDFNCVDPTFLRFWYKGPRTGQRIRFAFGDQSLDFDDPDRSREVFVYSTRYRRLDIPISNISLRHLGRVGFKIEDPHNGDYLLVDRISISSTVSSHLDIDLKEVKMCMNTRRYCDLIYGALPSRMDDYLAGVFRSVKMLKLALRE